MNTSIETIDRKYKVLEKIGGGGFSEVYLVEGQDGECALKLLKDVSAGSGRTALNEFKNEFAVLKNLNHPHIARILDFGFDDELGRYYYTSEMIRGKNLFDATGESDIQQITDLIVQSLRALEYLHSFRIYHFDIKAANVLVVPGTTPNVKLIDFGLAGIDPRGRLIGTPSYMSPEIVNREHADGRADLYSLGVLWYFCLTRFNPFRAKDPMETLQNQVRLVPPAPSGVNPNVPPWLDAVVMRLIEKNPAKRYAQAARVVREINRFSAKKYPLETRETLVSYLPQEGELIARKEELELVKAALDRIEKGGARFDSLAIVGGQGSGKSRFLREFKYEAQLSEIKVQIVSAGDAENYKEWRESLEKHVNKGQGLVVFILDDAEKLGADESAVQKLIQLVSRAHRPSGDARALLLIGCTEQEKETDPLACSIKSVASQTITLKNFSQQELTDYLASLTGLEKPPKALVEGIYRRTDGNPLFVTEVLKALITGGGLFDEGGRWRETVFEDVGVDFSKVKIPATVEELLLNGIEKLDKKQRSIIETLAVVRHPSTADELAAYSGVDDAFQALRDLVTSDFIERSEDHRYTFKNELAGHAIYESLPEEVRERHHDRISEALENSGAPFELIAHHSSFGCDKQKALSAANALGETYLKQGLGKKALRYFDRALEIAESDDVESLIDFKLKKGESLLIAKDFGAAEKIFSEVEFLLPTLPKTEKAKRLGLETLIRLGGTYMKLQAASRARAAFTEAKVKLHTQITDPVRELQVENFLGSVLMTEGRLREAKELFEKTRGAWRKLSGEDRARVTNNDLGMALMGLRDIENARAAFEEDLQFAKELDDKLLIGRAQYNIAQLFVFEHRFDEAIESYQRCAEVCRKSDNTELLLRAYNGLGNIYHLQGNLDQSVAYYERGLALHERAGDARGGAAISVNIGIIENSRQNYDGALDALIPAVELLKGIPDKTAADWAALSRGLLESGDVFKNRKEYPSALDHLTQAYDIAVGHDSASNQRFWILLTIAEAALATDDRSKLKSLIIQMQPLASTDDEKKKLADLAEGISIDYANSSMSTSHAEPQPAQKPARQRVSPYERVLEINKLIGAERELEYVLKTVIYYALDLSGAESGAIVLLDDNEELKVACQRNMDGRDDEVAFSRTLARRVLKNNAPVITDDALEDERFKGEESIAVHKLRSIMCLPVRARGKVIGVLYLDHRFTPGAFADADMKLIDAFADQAGLAIENARLVGALAKREEALRAELSAASVRIERFEEIIRGEAQFAPKLDYGLVAVGSFAMQEMVRLLDKVADTELSVLLVGESGVGKELIARALHGNHTKRKGAKFVAINCAAIPATLIESELFGYKAGAFTGAIRDKKGLIEEAENGTIFLDEIAELAPELQVKLLRVLQEREFTPVGGTKPVSCDVRVVAATNKDVERLVKDGFFRDDLYYRICQVKVVIPPLRERPEDIPTLAAYFVEESSKGKPYKLHPALVRKLYRYPWPGNVRELKSLMQVACAMAEGDTIALDSIPETSAFSRYFAESESEASKESKRPPAEIEAKEGAKKAARIDERNIYDPRKTLDEYERVILSKAIHFHSGNVAITASKLGISTATLYKRIKEWNLKDTTQSAFKDSFVYSEETNLDEYVLKIFKAAIEHFENKAMKAIAALGISQGYFYKVLRRVKKS